MIKRTTLERREYKDILLSTLDRVEVPKSPNIKIKGFMLIRFPGATSPGRVNQKDIEKASEFFGVSLKGNDKTYDGLKKAALSQNCEVFPVYKANTVAKEGTKDPIYDEVSFKDMKTHFYANRLQKDSKFVGLAIEKTNELEDDFSTSSFLEFLRAYDLDNLFIYDFYFKGKLIYTSGIQAFSSYDEYDFFTFRKGDKFSSKIKFDDPELLPNKYYKYMKTTFNNLKDILPHELRL